MSIAKGRDRVNTQADFMRPFLRHQATLLAFIMSRGLPAGEAEDVLQEAAVVLWSKFGAFRPGSDFRAWAFEVVRREVRKHRRLKRGLELPLDTETLGELERATLESGERLETEQGFLRKCMDRLSGTLRRLVDLRYGEDLSVGEIAGRLSRPAESVHVSLSRARKSLQECVRREARLAEAQ